MKVNDIWVRETQEEEQRFQIYQQNINAEDAKTREYAENWEYYSNAYRFFAELGPAYQGVNLETTGYYQELIEKIGACRTVIAENQRQLTGASEQESRLFTALASGDIPMIKSLADAGMVRAKFYYACHEAKQGNLQISRFKECMDRKESPYDAKAEMIILVYEADQLGKELADLKSRTDAMIKGTEDAVYSEYAATLKRMHDMKKQIGGLDHRMSATASGLKQFVKNRLVQTNSSWGDNEFLEMVNNLGKSAEIAEMNKKLKSAIDALELRRTRERKQRTKALRFFLKAGAVAVVVGGVYLFNSWVGNTYEGAKLYVELESKPKIVFQFETTRAMNQAEIPEKVLFFETEATTEQIFHTGEE